MKHLAMRHIAALMLALPLAANATTPATAPAAAAQALPSLADFFNNPEFSGAKISPSGRYLAAKLAAPNGRERLAVVDLNTNSVKSVAYFTDADVGSFRWVNDERLLFDTTDKQLGEGDRRFGAGLYAVNRDGEKFRQLANRTWQNFETGTHIKSNLLPWYTYMMGQRGAQDSEYVYVNRSVYNGPGDWGATDLLRLNTLTGHHTAIQRPPDTTGWLLDEKGEPRIATTASKGKSAIHLRDPKTGEWRMLVDFATYTGGKNAFMPLAFGPDGVFYVVAHAGRDKAAVFKLDLETAKLSDKPVVELAGYDFTGHLIFSNSKLLGVRYTTDAQGTMWFDDTMKAMQAEIDAKLPNTINLVTPPSHAETPNVLVESYSDVQPRITLVYNRETKTLNLVGQTRPSIKPEQMAQQDAIRYKARDGLQIPAWVTTPKGEGKNLPMVVLVHGGPYVRGGEWGWSPQAQFLASRGYAVLEPEYRGSTGFGDHHFKAGWKQWGLKMQDDIADGVKWAVDKGLADPKRICIAGASYGGYATLMGLVNNPDLFKCGVNWVGVTDISLMANGHWSYVSDLSDMWKEYGIPVLVGDPVKDAEQLKATSPLLQAARITQPLLLAYGGADKRVPLYHGNKFRDAIAPYNKQVEWIVYEEEGHGWALPKNRIDFWTRVEKFLGKHIGAEAKKE
ncbi:S9 family peptidase [Pseudoduganella ginsengisoli]|uniref:Prolyl oligopeptidase family serine peptidase n=1 Tax=Pseudoduganella ginsengisoli TaxID=1462440 RepID=A0A6L6PVA9_9BURK|nr:alpha/beta fold hydrolase [Pseudoduganella ginsengisoli]MTW01166.1 prolyl oligopeptidase family serine peptidase [Pseudoduganella ginsengisoli]